MELEDSAVAESVGRKTHKARRDSGSSVHSGRAGSSPASRTIQNPVVSTATGFFAAVSALFSALCWIIFLNASYTHLIHCKAPIIVDL